MLEKRTTQRTHDAADSTGELATGAGSDAEARSGSDPVPTVMPREVAAGASAGAEGRTFGEHVRAWAARQNWTLWLLFGIVVLAFLPRIYGLNWDANNQLHPDEREIMFRATCITFPGTPRDLSCPPAFTGLGWLFSPNSPLNPHFFAYGTFPQYLVAAVAHGLAWLTHITGGRFVPPDGGVWDDFNHFTLVGRALSALFDTGSVLLSGLIARRLAGRWAGILAAAFVAVIPFDVQVSHFYAVDTLLLFFVLLTLLACVRLVQGGAPAPIASVPDADTSEMSFVTPTRDIWRAWGGGAFIGVAFGLAMATKVSALPLLAPILAALILRGVRRGFDHAFFALLGVAAAAIVTFLIVSPYAVIDSTEFIQQVSEQTALSQGKLDYPYVRQFADTTPFLYQIRQLLLYDMTLPLGLLGIAGFGWAVARVWRSWRDEWTVIVVFLAVYFAVVGSAYMKFTRYMLPVFAPLAVCGAAALVAFARFGMRRLTAAHTSVDPGGGGTGWRALLRRDPLRTRPARGLTALYGVRWWRYACLGLGAVVIGTSLFFTLALVHIYSQPNTRVQASAWMYDHIPAGAVVTYEQWDRPLPLDVPAARTSPGGQSLTSAGHVINPGEYQLIGLDIYGEDTPDKAQQLSQQLASADVVMLSSNHLLHSIPKLPDRYPMTMRYYQLLFSGQLGFKLAAHFETHPTFLGIPENDTGADESFYFYDHPPVWIFTRDGAPLGADRIKAILADGIFLPAASTRSGSQKSLLLPAANAQANAESPALYSQFSPDSLANQIPLLWWLIAVELLGLAAFPLAYSVFPGLRDRGWGLAKMLGLLLLAYIVWLPSSVHLLPFDRWAVIAAFTLLAALGALIGWRRRAELREFVRARWRLLLICEVAFVVAFLFFAWVRALDPDLWHIWRGGEKPMEFAYLNAILRSRYMPPLDPFFSGGYINYYYYGQYLVAVLIKLTGILPATAFNLAVPLFFAVTFTAAFSVVAGLTGRWWAGLAGGGGLVVLGNLDGAVQALQQWQEVLAKVPVLPFDFWQSSRVIPYTINEFPFWSFLYGDLHAHLIDLPIVVLIVACCASLLATAKADGSRWRPAVPTLAVVALALGAAWCTSTWDVPTYAMLVAVVLAVRLLPFGASVTWDAVRAHVSWQTLRGYLLALGLTLGATYLLYLPFHTWFYNFLPGGTGPVTTPTPPNLFFTIFGLWLFLAVTLFLFELRDRLERRWAERGEAPPGTPAMRLLAVALGGGVALTLLFLLSVKLFLIAMLGLGLYLALNPRHSSVKLMTYILLLLGLAVALGVELIYVRDFLDSPPWNRMNTVFKFYYQVWTLFALGGALAFAQIIRRMLANDVSGVAHAWEPPAGNATSPERGGALDGLLRTQAAFDRAKSLLRSAWLVALVALVLGSCVFLVEGTQARVQDPVVWAEVQPPPGGLQPKGLSLDGMAFMAGWYPGDYEAINWMNAHISGTPTIVEASYGTYNWQGRVAVYTGLPAVLDQNHEDEQRFPDQVATREAAVTEFWATEDPSEALTFLRHYSVRYVYLGALERTCYTMYPDAQNPNVEDCQPMSAGALAKLQALQNAGILQVAHRNADVVIYKVVG